MHIILFLIALIFIKRKEKLSLKEAFVCFIPPIMQTGFAFTEMFGKKGPIPFHFFTNIIEPPNEEPKIYYENFYTYSKEYARYFFAAFVIFCISISIIYIYFILKKLKTHNNVLFVFTCFAFVSLFCLSHNKNFEILRNLSFVGDSIFCITSSMLIYWNLKALQYAIKKDLKYKLTFAANFISGLYILGVISYLPFSLIKFVETIAKLLKI